MLKNSAARPEASASGVQVSEEARQETAAFITRRLQGMLLEAGFRHDVVDAVLAVRGDNPVAARRACQAVQAMVDAAGWETTFTAYARCVRITRTLDAQLALNPAAYQEQVEHDLHAAYTAAAAELDRQAEPADGLGAVLVKLAPAINAYFDKVLVNADDPALRQARLALVQQIGLLPSAVADLSKLQGF